MADFPPWSGYPAPRSDYGSKRKMTLTIGQLAAAAEVNFETVRYYERIGLMPSPARTASGHRTYEDEHIRRLVFIRRARELGFSIEDIRALLALAEPSRASCADVKGIAQAHLDEVRKKMADLKKLERILSRTIAGCSGEKAPPCPVLDMLVARRAGNEG
jgi:MerR family transcriptional regulator, mercuric resistance operon regulatory protein